jgi:hypothetical protein
VIGFVLPVVAAIGGIFDFLRRWGPLVAAVALAVIARWAWRQLVCVLEVLEPVVHEAGKQRRGD